MTSAEKNALHISVLQLLRTKAEIGLPESALHTFLRTLGHDLALPALQAELRALADRNLIAAFAPLGSPRWRITALGESHLTEAGL